MDHMTALVSAFARAYHYKNNRDRVFADPLAEKLLTEEEYAAIARNMSEGVAYFAPDFQGTREEALRFVAERQLAPSVLARSAFCERALDAAGRLGCRQVVLFASGYDTLSLRAGEGRIFELDLPDMIADKRARMARSGLTPVCQVEWLGCDLSRSLWKGDLLRAGFDAEQQAFGSLLGLSYYLTREEFTRLIGTISSIWRQGSSLCFDYPQTDGGAESGRHRALAAAAGERMKARYSYGELEELLSEAGFLIYEHLNAAEATEAFFRKYNRGNAGHAMAAPEGVGYCLAVKKG